ncbi:hypothetical protein BV25DRAFT_1921645 [Artomyces pyxidatus]|uniref:Uncharacterized protein n=1 Tax=Artomyces pyxidatus TaxID=48021 RepID=A0ACB8SIZ3_9AGAM|nr:hypothetical protein BV25DRAFT_1921645 [Artomyces pyxidatus]
MHSQDTRAHQHTTASQRRRRFADPAPAASAFAEHRKSPRQTDDLKEARERLRLENEELTMPWPRRCGYCRRARYGEADAMFKLQLKAKSITTKKSLRSTVDATLPESTMLSSKKDREYATLLDSQEHVREEPALPRISVQWAPAHKGIKRNELADKFAKEAVDRPLIQRGATISKSAAAKGWAAEWRKSSRTNQSAVALRDPPNDKLPKCTRKFEGSCATLCRFTQVLKASYS